MNNENAGQDESAFVNDPNTLDFIVRNNEYYIDFISNHPNVRFSSMVLSDRYIVAYASQNDLPFVRELLGTNFYSAQSYIMGLLDRAELEAAGIIQVQEQTYLELKGQGVLIGFVDTGIDYTNPVFRYEDGTSKIVSIFDESASGSAPEGFLIGTEYTNEQINQALQAEDPYSIVPQRDTVGHGTFLASLAAGRETDGFIGAAPDSELIIVKLKKARNYYLDYFLVPPWQENVYESSAVAVGVDYIIRKARQLNRPVAICLGVGTNLGGHDSSSILEQYIADISNISGICICTAAGNESQARHHTSGVITKTGGTQNIEINAGETVNNIFISILNAASDRLSVSLRSPTGEVVGRVPAKSNTVFTTRLVLEQARITVEYFFPIEGSSGQATIIRIIDATPGIWTVTLYGDIILDGSFSAYLPLTGLVNPDVEFLAPNPNFTVVVPATAYAVISAGAYNSVDNRLYVNSSWGPSRVPTIVPDFVAPGVDVGGIYPSGHGKMSGTSVAAAITTGASALMLQWGIIEKNDVALSTYQIKGFMIRGCERDENQLYPNNQWGYGKLDLYNTFNLMREF